MTKLEDRQDKIEMEVAVLKATVAEQKDQLKDANEKLDEILLELSRYKGIVGGLMLAGSCILAFFKFGVLSWFTKS